MAFFHIQAPIIYPIQPHHDHPHSASGNHELDVETALIAKFVFDGLTDSLPSDDEVAYRLQSEQYDQWLSIVEDAKLAKSIDGALATDAAYLDTFITVTR